MSVCGSSGNQKAKQIFLFSGQGNPAPGMGREVCDISSETQTVWDCASEISGTDVRKLCLKGPMARLSQTRDQQLAVTTVNMAMLIRLRESLSCEPEAYAGHSVGEYTALYAAGVLDMESLFYAVVRRGEIMQDLAEKQRGAMYVLKQINYSQVLAVIQQLGLQQQVSIACDNSHTQQVIGGEEPAVKEMVRYLSLSGISAIRLIARGAWHTPLMADGVSAMREMLEKLPFSPPVKTVFMNRSASEEQDINTIRDNLALHLTETVRWRELMDSWWHKQYRYYIEIGHKKTLSPLLESAYAAYPDKRICHFSAFERSRSQNR